MKNHNLKLRIIFFLILFFGIFGFTKISYAANHYVRANAAAANDGSNWSNAWTNLPATLVRGETYYVASGDYGSHDFNDPESGNQYIYIKKATVPDHGTDTGWDSSYANGQANWNYWSFSKGYYTFDGMTGFLDNRSSYGFHLRPSSCNFSTSNNYLVGFAYGINPGASHCEFRHIFFEGCGNTDPYCSYAIHSNSALGENIGSIIANNLFYGHAVHLVLYHWSQTIVENNFFDSNWSTSNCHGEQVTFGGNSDDVIYRFNIHRNSQTGGLAVHHNNNNRWKVYGNIFYGGNVATGVIGTADSGTSHPDVIKNWEVYNNTIYNVTGYGNGAGFWQGECTDTAFTSKVYNNLFVSTIHPVFSSSNQSCVDHNYNSFYNCTWLGPQSWWPTETHMYNGSGDPFVNAGGSDFRLAGATTPGIVLPLPFNIDFLGAIRGADGVWDRGAYEYVEAAPPPDTTPPAAPSGVSII